MKRRELLVLGGLSTIAAGVGRQWLEPTAAQAMTPLPASDRPLDLRFIAVADTGTGARGQYDVAAAMERYRRANPYRLALLAGDNIYNNGEIEKVQAVFERPYAPLLNAGVQFRAVLGNHDIRTNNGVDQLRYPKFNMAGRYYNFREGPVEFFALDTNGNADWQNQLVWLDRTLRASTAPWKVVFGHHPIYSSGFYGVNRSLISRLVPLFKRHGVQLYISGHDHSYERTQPIEGTTYLIVGAGAGLRPVGRSAWTAKSASTLSFAGIDVLGNELRIQTFDKDSRLIDQGQIMA